MAVNNITVSIAGTIYPIRKDTFSFGDKVDERSRCAFTVIDVNGTVHFSKGQQVSVSDSSGVIFTGVVNTSIENKIAAQSMIFHTIDCIDPTFYVDKRTTNKLYTNQYTGVIAADIHKTVLAAEGITAQYALKYDTLQSDFASGTLSGTVSQSTNGQYNVTQTGSPSYITESTTANFSTGTLAGVTAANNTLAPTPITAAKMVAVCSTAGSDYCYQKIWAGSQAVASAYYLIYDIFLSSSCPEKKLAVDITFSDATNWRDTYTYSDQNAAPPHPATDLSSYAVGKWYRRVFRFTNYSAKTISSVTIACEGDLVGTYTGWIKRIVLCDSSQNVLFTFFGGTLNTNTAVSNVNYSSVTVSTISTYDLSLYTGAGAASTTLRTSPSTPLAGVGTLANTGITWTATVPSGTKFLMRSSINGGSTWQDCPNPGSISGLTPGQSMAGVSIQFQELFFYDNSSLPSTPEAAPVLSNVSFFAQPTVTSSVSGSDDGDLELATSGSTVVIQENNAATFSTGWFNNGCTVSNGVLTPQATNAIKVVAVQSIPNNSNSYSYVQIWSGSITVTSNSFIDYDIWCDPTCPECKIGVDLIFSDGTNWRDTAVYKDVQSLAPHPATDLGGVASGTWYHRDFFLANYAGKTIVQCNIACEGDKTGTYTAWIKNIFFTDASRVPISYFFQSAIQSGYPQQLQTNGYSSMTLSVVPTYALDVLQNNVANTPNKYTIYYSIDAVKILKSSYLHWDATVPANTTFVVKWTLDPVDYPYIQAYNNAPLQGLPAGTNLAGRYISFSLQFFRTSVTISPEITPTLSNLVCTFYPSFSATKSDVYLQANSQAAWNLAGTTLSNVLSTSSILQLNGAVRYFDDGSNANQDLYSTSTPGQVCSNKVYTLSVPAGAEARSRMTFAPQIADGLLEFDIYLDTTTTKAGCVYRTSGWSNYDGTFAYSVEVNQSTVAIWKGSNNAGATGSFMVTSVASASITVGSGSWHHFKVLFIGSNHKVYIDNVLVINATDSTYTGAGYVGLRNSNPTASTYVAQFDNFGFAVASLTGTWTSKSTSLAAAGTYYTSYVYWRDRSLNVSSTTNIVQSSVDGGSTWQSCPIGSPLQGLTVGQSLTSTNLLVKVTLQASTSTSLPQIDSLSVVVLGGMTSTGTRTSTALSLAPVGRVGNTVIAWTANQPTNTSVAIATSLDGTTWTNATNGSAIPGINQQGTMLLDTFKTNTSSNYTSTTESGGATATWTWDTANSRLVATGGSAANLLVNAYTGVTDFDLSFDTDYSDFGGVIFRRSASNTFYKIGIADSGTGSLDFELYRTLAGSETTIGSTSSFSFTRGTYHRFRIIMMGGIITVYEDGSQILTYTDSSPLAGGQIGLRNSRSGTARFYNLRIQPLGDDLTSKQVYTRATLTTTDPTATPQLLDLTIAALSPNIGLGTLIPVADFRYTYASDDLNNLAQKSGDYYWNVQASNALVFAPRQLMPAPWILVSSDTQLLLNGMQVEANGDTYYNRVVLTGVLDQVTKTEKQIGDGSSTSWDVGYPVVSAPTILVNGVAQTVGVKGVDTGKAFYWASGSTTITQDSSGTVLVGPNTTTGQAADVLTITYTGRYSTTVTRDNTSMSGTTTQSQFASVSGGTGIVERIIDVTSQNLTVSAANSYGDALLQRNGVIGRIMRFQTLRAGLATGQFLTAFIPEHNIMDATFLVTSVDVSARPVADSSGQSTMQYVYSVEATEGPNTDSWAKLFSQGLM